MKQHPLCTDTEHGHDVMNLPVPSELKREWATLQTRRHFLGRTGKVLGWAAIASLLGDRALRGDTHPADQCSAGIALRRALEASALRSESKTRDLSVHVGRSVAG